MSGLKVIISGALGKMGKEAVKAVYRDPETEIAGAVDLISEGEDVGTLALGSKVGASLSRDLEGLLSTIEADVVVDFTTPTSVMNNLYTCLKNKVPPVVGTTGLTDADFQQVEAWTDKFQTGAIIVPNFALGAVLMMKFARIASRFFKDAEIIELHHDGKVDAPSGTALKTAQQIHEIREGLQDGTNEESILGESKGKQEEIEKLPGARGGNYQGINVHSVRLPGLVAHQEVIFGGEGQTLTIRHDSLDRVSFMPGLLLAVKKAPQVKGMVYGLEHLMDLEE